MRSPFLRRLLVAASLIMSTLSVGACERADEGKAQVTVIGEPPEIVDPAAGPLTAPQAVLLQNVAQGLVRFDATGQIVPGLAERWNVTDDGLSYIFRLETIQWSDGGKVTAQQVARLLKKQLASRSDNPLKDTLGAVDEIKAMTDRVIEISLKAPRPNLLALFAQPEFAIVYENQGTGPFQVAPDSKPPRLELVRTVTNLDEEVTRKEQVLMDTATAPKAVRAFLNGKTDLVLGGTFADLPYARVDKLPKNALRFDPAAGLFGLVPAKLDSPLADLEFRRLLSRAIDRQAMIEALNVPGLLPRATVLEPGLDGVPDPVAPEWTGIPLDQRRQELVATANRVFGGLQKPVIRIALPDAPGAKIMLNRLARDWGAIGLTVEATKNDERPDLLLVDVVAPSNSAAWYLRQFRCDQARICDESIDELLDGARNATVPAQRYALLAQAAQRVDEEQLFIPITAPIRWSLVSDGVQGFANNRFARHTLTGLRDRLDRERSE
jgi:peptide/nickel transport system substrate-binding protein